MSLVCSREHAQSAAQAARAKKPFQATLIDSDEVQTADHFTFFWGVGWEIWSVQEF